MVEYAAGIAPQLMGNFVENVAGGMDTFSIRQPLGVRAPIPQSGQLRFIFRIGFVVSKLERLKVCQVSCDSSFLWGVRTDGLVLMTHGIICLAVVSTLGCGQ